MLPTPQVGPGALVVPALTPPGQERQAAEPMPGPAPPAAPTLRHPSPRPTEAPSVQEGRVEPLPRDTAVGATPLLLPGPRPPLPPPP